MPAFAGMTAQWKAQKFAGMARYIPRVMPAKAKCALASTAGKTLQVCKFPRRHART
jgi:hypothetical protein